MKRRLGLQRRSRRNQMSMDRSHKKGTKKKKSDSQPNNYTSQPVEIDLTDLINQRDLLPSSTLQVVRSKGDINRETNAHFIGRVIIFAFCGSLAFIFLIFGVLLVRIIFMVGPDAVATDLIPSLGSIFDLLTTSLTTISTLFNSLLAFILGYYFNESRSGGKSKDEN